MNWANLTSANSYLPVQGSTLASDVDAIYNTLTWLSILFFVILMGGMSYFVYKYKRKTDNDKTAYITHNHTLEFIWSFIPLVLLLGIFFWGYKVYNFSRTFPKNAITIQTFAKQWMWSFKYASGRESANELVVPAKTPVILTMTSEDVLHAFYVPSFRIQQGVVPGQRTSVWFEAPEPGVFKVFCTQYCGTAHSKMMADIRVLPPSEYEEWLKTDPSAGLTLAGKGEALYKIKGCVACHSTDGTARVGPSWKGIFGTSRKFADGSSIPAADENYIHESILSPNTKVVAGFPAGQMPSFQGQISEDEITNLIEYIKTLK